MFYAKSVLKLGFHFHEQFWGKPLYMCMFLVCVFLSLCVFLFLLCMCVYMHRHACLYMCVFVCEYRSAGVLACALWRQKVTLSSITFYFWRWCLSLNLKFLLR